MGKVPYADGHSPMVGISFHLTTGTLPINMIKLVQN